MKITKILESALLIAATLIFLVLVAAFLSLILINRSFGQQNITLPQVNFQNYRLLDGQLLEAGKTELRPIAVVLENHFESRPISGLDQASIIYEVIVEGDISRFLAIFAGDISAKKIGPVRSVRPFFVDLAQEWQPILFHAGGSVEGLAQLKASPVDNINEISADGIYFWRDPNRSRPHNLYTSANLIKRAIVAKEIDSKVDFSPWLFKDDQPEGDGNELVSSFTVDFSGNPLYRVRYEYNQQNNNYTRYLSGKVHKTDQGIILKAKNIVIQKVDFEIVDDYGRLDIDVSGGGKAEIYQDGRKIVGSWKKIKGRTRFYNQAGEEIKFNRGTIWVELVFNNFKSS